MSILKYKYQAHRLINYIFYIIVFLIGFLLGHSSKEVNINKLISDFLFIDNVSAYEINIDDHIFVTESDILDSVNTHVSDFVYDDNNNVFCTYDILNNYYELSCLLLNDLDWNNIYLTNYQSETNSRVFINLPQSSSAIYSVFHYSKSTYDMIFSNAYRSVFASSYNSFVSRIFTNTNFPSNENSTIDNSQLKAINKNVNKLDFITPQLNYNENLFENTDDFKQVCVNSTDTFLISSNDYNRGGHVLADYLWFPYNIKGLEQGVYKTSDDSLVFNDEIEKYFFKNAKKINKTFDETAGLPFSTYNYPFENRYSYFGWLAVPFIITYDENDYMFYVFRFKDDSEIVYYNDIESGGGAGHYFGEGEEPPTEYCFYINNLYEVQTLETDNNGNHYGTVVTPEGEINIYSSNSNSFFSSFNDNDFGLSKIITSPLRAIRRIGQGACSPQTVTLLNKNITIPCGDTIFWNRQDVSTFKVFWNMFWGGILCYGIGISLYRLVHRLRNPSDDKVEVLDL